MQKKFLNKETLKQFISDNRLNETVRNLIFQFNEFLDKNKNDIDYEPIHKLLDALIINSGKLNELELNKNIGILDRETQRITTAEVQKAVLYIIDQLPPHFWSNKNSENQLTNHKKDYKLIIGIILLIFIFSIVGIFVIYPKYKQTAIKSQDTIKQLDTIENINKSLIHSDKTPNLKTNPSEIKVSEPKYFTIKLIVNSKMQNALIYIDGKPATIIENTLTIKTIKVKFKEGSYHFLLKNQNDSCSFETAINENNLKLTACD